MLDVDLVHVFWLLISHHSWHSLSTNESCIVFWWKQTVIARFRSGLKIQREIRKVRGDLRVRWGSVYFYLPQPFLETEMMIDRDSQLISFHSFSTRFACRRMAERQTIILVPFLKPMLLVAAKSLWYFSSGYSSSAYTHGEHSRWAIGNNYVRYEYGGEGNSCLQRGVHRDRSIRLRSIALEPIESIFEWTVTWVQWRLRLIVSGCSFIRFHPWLHYLILIGKLPLNGCCVDRP